MDLAHGLEVLRSWLLTAFNAGILALLVKLYIDNRKLRLAERTRQEDFQLKVSADGRTNLQFVIDNLVRDIEAQRKAHQDCENRLSKVTDDYNQQGKRLDGLQRQFIAFQLDIGRAIPPGDRTPILEDILKQYDELAARKEKKGG